MVSVDVKHQVTYSQEVGGEGEHLYLTLRCHHQNDFCIKMGSNESHVNVSLIVRGKVTTQCPQTTTFEEEEELKQGIEPMMPAYRLKHCC